MATEFNAGSFLGRWIFALALVLGTYNPTQWCYFTWATAESTTFGPIVAIAGLVLLICWIIFIRATFMSMGWLGITLEAALFGCVVWLMVDQGWLSLESEGTIAWVVLIILSLILAVGMSWSHIRRRLSGQFDVDEKDD
ncbi:MAG: hypothetical protein KDI10_11325 [Halioglobus sp.]|nr:hypothetical protein [Halioglobus sp.]MCB1709305.1 hypothetical protein [Halioglobus sp.]MCP5122724.1 hypothetical protein [Pseudomonadales bacterium]MCP5191894.1 hypothetical protein [Pseudomonadales bacterium]HPE81437.1 DUF6524 family protein [Gammaproteobacteria bacterium]